jgi:two-component system KDP operon response regulator KdpE
MPAPSHPRETPETVAPLVLVIEDAPQLSTFIATGLRGHGYRVVLAASARDGAAMAAQHRPDLVLLDLELPDFDGKTLIPELRRGGATPIVVLSARHEETEKVAALDAGADEYVTKPFGFDELLARMRVALRHAARLDERGGSHVFERGPLRVDLEARRVTIHGEDVHLTPIEYKLLVALVRNAGRVMTHGALLHEVWGSHTTERTHYLRVYMTHLRRKLASDPELERLIVTEAGVGYRLAG